MTEKRVSVKISAEGGRQLKAELADIGSTGKKAFEQVEGSARRSGAGLQNASYQIADVFTQITAGTDPMRAIAIQLPQLLGGLGLIGVVAGAAAAGLGVLVPMMFDTGEKAKSADEALKGLTAAIDGYRSFIKTAATDTADLAKEFSGFAYQIKDLSGYLGQVSLGKTLDELNSAITPLKGSLAGVDTAVQAVARAQEYLNGIDKNEYPELWMNAKDALELYQGEADKAAEKVGLTLDQAKELSAAFDGFSPSQSMADMAISAGNVLEVMRQIVPAGQDLPAPLIDAAFAMDEIQRKAAAAATETSGLVVSLVDGSTAMQALNSLAPQGGWLAGAIADASTLAGTLWGAARAAAAARAADGGKPGMDTGSTTWWYGKTVESILPPEAGFAPSRTGSKGGGGGGGGSGKTKSPEDRDREEALRMAEQLIRGTRSEAETYARVQKQLNILLDEGKISQDTYNKALDELGEKYGDAKEAAKGFKDITTDLKDAILDFAVDGTASFEQVAKSIQKMMLQAALFGEGPFGKLFGGGADGGGGLLALFGKALGLPSFDGGGSTGSGARVGGVDGKGGYYAILHPQEHVTDLTRLRRVTSGGGSGGGGGVVVQNIDQRKSGADVETQTSTMPDGRTMIINTIRDAEGRGEFDKGRRARWGTRPQTVKR